jgi:hypothetical protein
LSERVFIACLPVSRRSLTKSRGRDASAGWAAGRQAMLQEAGTRAFFRERAPGGREARDCLY